MPKSKDMMYKFNSVQIGEGIPKNRDGDNGDITIRHVKGSGVYLFIKLRNRWYSRQFLSGKGYSSNIKEINLDNPINDGMFFAYDSRSGKYVPVDTGKVFTLDINSKKGELRLGNVRSTNADDANKHSIALGVDNSSLLEGQIFLGSGTSNYGESLSLFLP